MINKKETTMNQLPVSDNYTDYFGGTNKSNTNRILQLFDAIGITLWFALTGAGNTLFPAIVESCLTWGVIVLGSYVFGVVLGLGFKTLWLLFPVYMGLFAGIMIWKIRKGDWKNIQI